MISNFSQYEGCKTLFMWHLRFAVIILLLPGVGTSNILRDSDTVFSSNTFLQLMPVSCASKGIHTLQLQRKTTV